MTDTGLPEVSSVRAIPKPDPTVLLNPGPVVVHSDVRAAMSYPDVCHREQEAADLMKAVREKIVAICGGAVTDHVGVVLAGSGTAALEAVLSSVVPADGKVLVLDNGNYGERLYRITLCHGIAHRRLEFGWTEPIDIDSVDELLAADQDVTHVAMVHHETSTGMLNPLRRIGEIVHRHNRSLVVDAISSLGSEELDVSTDHVDWCVGSANKNLEGLPGVSFVCASRTGLESLEGTTSRTFYLDLYSHYRSQEDDQAPLFTPAVQVLYAFDRALDLALSEGVHRRRERYEARAARIRNGITDLGLRFLLPLHHRANSVTHVRVPERTTYRYLHDSLKEKGFIVYACQERLGEVFRIANMGLISDSDIDRFLAALDDVLRKARASTST
ncbi:2-aminoethylphosphonate-pyruvate transaminase [Actinopolyspora mzabensis]|uniref:2-aminoethylphosphonate--pyruvate transaminase n=1 Tax=Actinopolyspora mzabensis TaxID=995066 RepID=A0A1G9A0Z1_ACTMZ|nr:2-aminoethylphosphonate-pyruvate transaminase [Actinopolyspora mzabensis]